jgi:hypothetical protein
MSLMRREWFSSMIPTKALKQLIETPDSDSASLGSNPSPPATLTPCYYWFPCLWKIGAKLPRFPAVCGICCVGAVGRDQRDADRVGHEAEISLWGIDALAELGEENLAPLIAA